MKLEIHQLCMGKAAGGEREAVREQYRRHAFVFFWCGLLCLLFKVSLIFISFDTNYKLNSQRTVYSLTLENSDAVIYFKFSCKSDFPMSCTWPRSIHFLKF